MIYSEVLFSAPILFFLLGFIAKLIKSDLEIPEVLAKFFSLYILCALGLKGGVNIAQAGFNREAVYIFTLAIIGSFGIGYIAYHLFKFSVEKDTAAACASCYGSVSAVTFITGIACLTRLNISYSPYMIACMALMESPAIILAIILYKKNTASLKASFIHGITNQSVILLIGCLGIGLCLSKRGWESISPFYEGLFNGMLTLFLLELGLLAAQQLPDLKKTPRSVFILALALPIGAAFICLGACMLMGLRPGDTFLLMLLFGSASYIAAPAAMRTLIPSAKSSIYLSLSIGLTFPFSILVGIPFYLWILSKFYVF